MSKFFDTDSDNLPTTEKRFAPSSVLPPGLYTVLLTDDMTTGHVDRRVSKRTGAEYLSMTFRIISPEKYKGKPIFDILALNNPYRIKNLYHAVEPDREHRRPLDLSSDEDLHNAFYYKPLLVSVEQETYNGKTRPKVVEMYSLSNDEYKAALAIAQVEINKAENKYWGSGPREELPPVEFNESEPTQNLSPSRDQDDDIPF